jgi:hypothetical protein
MDSLVQCRKCAELIAPSRFCPQCGADLATFQQLPKRVEHGSEIRGDLSGVLSGIPDDSSKNLGFPREGRELIVPNSGSRVDELIGNFVRRIQARRLNGVEISKSRVSIADGLHIVVRQRVEGTGAVNLLVRFFQQGSDAMLGWRCCHLGARTDVWPRRWFTVHFLLLLAILAALLFNAPKEVYGGLCFGFVVLALITAVTGAMRLIGIRKSRFKYLASETKARDLSLSVRAALAEAIDDAQLTDFVQELNPSDPNKKLVI